jgi:hypothetical protein
MVQTGKDLVADLQRRVGPDVQIHLTIHRHQGRLHYHLATDRPIPQYKVERSIAAALEMRRERGREWAREQQRGRELEARLDRALGTHEREVISDLHKLEQAARLHELDRALGIDRDEVADTRPGLDAGVLNDAARRQLEHAKEREPEGLER